MGGRIVGLVKAPAYLIFPTFTSPVRVGTPLFMTSRKERLRTLRLPLWAVSFAKTPSTQAVVDAPR